MWYAAAAATSWSFGYTSMFNSDLWFHLAAGREIWQRRAIPAVDSWSFTAAGRPWHNHEWLADILFHAWAAAFGIEALVYWQWAVLIATFTVLFHLLQRLAGSRPVAWLLLLLALAVAAPFFDIRPHLYSLLGFVLLLELTLLRPPSWWVPALVLVWVNLHGGAVFGLLALGLLLAAWLAAPGEERDWRQALAAARRRLPRAVGIAVASGVAALVNPHGVAALLYPLRLAAAGSSASRTTLVEWLPPFAPGGIQSPVFPWAIAVAACAAATILGFGGRWRWRRRSWATLTLCGLTLAMALESRRFITLFAIASALLAAVAWRALRERLARLPRGVSGLEPLAAAAAVAFAVTRLLPYPQGTAAFLPLTRMDRLPVDTLDFAAANDLQGRVFNYFLWGGYLDYRTGGRLAVFLDPRSETVFADETQRRYMRVHFLRAGWEEVVRESAADFVLWPTGSRRWDAFTQRLLGSGRWRPIHRDAVSILLARSDLPLPPLRPSAASPWRSWALGRQERAAGRRDAAASHFGETVAALPQHTGACRDLVGVLRELGRHASARATARRCLAAYPDPRLRAALGDS